MKHNNEIALLINKRKIRFIFWNSKTTYFRESHMGWLCHARKWPIGWAFSGDVIGRWDPLHCRKKRRSRSQSDGGILGSKTGCAIKNRVLQWNTWQSCSLSIETQSFSFVNKYRYMWQNSCRHAVWVGCRYDQLAFVGLVEVLGRRSSARLIIDAFVWTLHRRRGKSWCPG